MEGEAGQSKGYGIGWDGWMGCMDIIKQKFPLTCVIMTRPIYCRLIAAGGQGVGVSW